MNLMQVDTGTKRLRTKRLQTERRRDKTSTGQNIYGQNVPQTFIRLYDSKDFASEVINFRSTNLMEHFYYIIIINISAESTYLQISSLS